VTAGRTSTRSRASGAARSPRSGRGNAWDVAWTALFLASDESRFVTGQCLAVDGGALQMAPLMVYQLGLA